MSTKRYKVNHNQVYDVFKGHSITSSLTDNDVDVIVSTLNQLWDYVNAKTAQNQMLYKKVKELEFELDLHKHPLWSTREAEKVVKKLEEENQQLKQDDLIFFQQVWDILMKYQYLFNREMADDVLNELGIELPNWFD